MNITLTDIEGMSIREKREAILKLELLIVIDRLAISDSKCVQLQEKLNYNFTFSCEIKNAPEITRISNILGFETIKTLADNYLTQKAIYFQNGKAAILEAEIEKAKAELADMEAELLIINT